MKNLFRVTAFPKTPDGGNKAGVYIEADNLSETQMQAIAKAVNYSETAFVMPSDKADFKVRFFTPLAEVDLCGHATIATFNLLRDLRIISTGSYRQETKAGILELIVNESDVYMEQPRPIFSEKIGREKLKGCFRNLSFDERLDPQIVSTGLREIFLPIRDREALNKLIPERENIKLISKQLDVIGIHAFCTDQENVDAYGRNFAPLLGIDEESATGTSNGALACYLFKHGKRQENFVLRQGYSMDQPSEISVRLKTDQGEISKVWIGGTARILKEE